MMNGEKHPYYREKAIPELKHLADELGVENAIFQQDSAPCHTSKVEKKIFSDKNIECLEWPGYRLQMSIQ